ncbi:hypothetical protein PR202_ga08817 [Eleusine coracana subsp. coracana]|uniref:K-box domain-containing protein n=1 Tax=Eleusine coracana subsp. coracana TaxID=191504 RepID=A0AAV5C278_ELECO|nr:hypothetical protein PR202_ga08817 [Eleusine coracana subsp. coracana]
MQLPYLFPHNVPSSSGNESPDLPSISISNPQRFQIDRYKKASASTSGSAPVIDVNSHQYFQQEAAKLRQQIQTLQNSNRHLMGESIGNMTAKELKNLESRLERGIGRIRSKKHELLFAEIEYMQKRDRIELVLIDTIMCTQVAEADRAQQQAASEDHEMVPATAGGASTELQALPASFDPRGYYQQQVSMLAAASASSSQYSEHPGQEHHQTALHLGYHIKQVDAGKGLL